jgi:hypothetical protein
MDLPAVFSQIAKALGLTIPLTLLAIADEVMEQWSPTVAVKAKMVSTAALHSWRPRWVISTAASQAQSRSESLPDFGECGRAKARSGGVRGRGKV